MDKRLLKKQNYKNLEREIVKIIENKMISQNEIENFYNNINDV